MLTQFDLSGEVVLPGGRIVRSELEETCGVPGEAEVDIASPDVALGSTNWRPSMCVVAR